MIQLNLIFAQKMRKHTHWTVFKALFMVLTMAWLYGYQSYHRLVEHANHNHSSCESTHSHSHTSSDANSGSDSDCEVCKVIASAFAGSPSYSYSTLKQEGETVYFNFYNTPSYPSVILSPPHRGPPA